MAKHKWIGMQVYCFVDNFEALVEPVIQVINGVEDHFCFHNPQTNTLSMVFRRQLIQVYRCYHQ